jgi:hypothetical protein
MKYLLQLAATVIFGGIGVLAQAQESEPMAREVAARPSESPEVETARYVLLTDGRILVGDVSPHKEGGFEVQQKLGAIRIQQEDVEGLFPSMRAIYEYKREHLPPRDIQERMRLYRWCMSRELLEQAREQLQAVLALSPEHEEAKSNLGLLEIRMTRRETRTDDAIVRTSATKPVENMPREMDPAFLNRALREMAARNSPIIFDLPEPQAVKRGQEFNQVIHPMLQVYCGNCHNERTPNGFPLVSATGRAARDPAVQRANLDTTLKLVNPENLMQSPLLVNSLLPHKPHNRPIFQGPNHPAYQLLSNWVSQLQARNPTTVRNDRPAMQAGFGRSPEFAPDDRFGEPGGFADRTVSTGFAVEGRLKPVDSDRPAMSIEANPDVVRVPRGQLPGQGYDQAEPAMPGRIVPGSYNGGSPNVPKGTTFPLPLPAGASPEQLLKALQAEEAERDARSPVDANRPGASDDEDAKPAAEIPAQGTEDAKKPKKPVKIDQNLLDKFILQRRSGG